MKLPAPAKVNLYLTVTGVRHDGMHELDTAFAYVDAADELAFSASETIRLECDRQELNGERNLVYRVLVAFREAAGVREGLHVRLIKRLPLQAGLGGGSSDAATALMAANVLWRVHWPRQRLIEFATPFGADIPCFLFGEASRAWGIGDRLQAYDGDWPGEWVLLVWPGSGASTPAVFRHYDARHALTASGRLDTMRHARRLGRNDLEASACALNPSIARLLERMRQHAKIAWMSGSGSTCVGLFAQRAQAERIGGELQAQGLCTWTHVGRLMRRHPVPRMIENGA